MLKTPYGPGEAHPGSAGVPPASERPEAAPMACGHICGRDARAPRVAASNARFVSSQCVPPAKRLFGNGSTQTALT
ncbi:MAG: hypothetical protein L0338_36065, partial [Acidobacteria bacterium]|nr:hypothetical protein [Acidobacteriota bacterium]